jgi:membrane-associated protease RseP (regulator of RpoE activity)
VLSRRDVLIHAGLFLACCVTTWWAAELNQAGSGVYFAGTLMGILACHEAGHYVVGRHHGVDVSLPYFIPLPPVITLGTLGAVIRMNRPISDPNKLFDVGASGPVAGLVVAIPLLVVASTSEVGPLTDSSIEGNSILYALPAGGVGPLARVMASTSSCIRWRSPAGSGCSSR